MAKAPSGSSERVNFKEVLLTALMMVAKLNPSDDVNKAAGKEEE